jgi:hypothetical protein
VPSPRFTQETARQAGIKSAELKKQRKARAAVIAAYAPLPALAPVDPTDTVRATELSRVLARLDALDRLMAQAKTDREWDNLSRAYERVFKAWVHLAGIPGPGNRKPGPDRKRDKPTGQTATVTIAPVQPPAPPANPG